MEPEHIFYGVLAFSWLEFLWEVYLGQRQRRVYKTNTTVPKELKEVYDEKTFDKSRKYALDKSNFGAIQGIFNQVLSSLLIWLFAFKYVWDVAGTQTMVIGYNPKDEIVRSIIFVFIFNVFNTVIGLPFSVYNTFVLEEKHGFNKQTVPFYIKDQIKKFVVGQVIMLPLIAAIIKIIQWGGDFFFVYLWGFVVFFTLFMMIIYPEFIAPLFDRYTPLPEGELRKQIESLAASIKFPLYKLFVVEGSKRSSHSNAYFYGFFNFKRIVLFDTLLIKEERDKIKEKKEEDEPKDDGDENDTKGCSNEEILAVLGHELGHWSLNHVLKNIVISQVHIFLMFALFAYLYQLQMLYTAFGFPNEKPILIGLMIILQYITAPYNAVLDFAMTVLSRRFEFQADSFAKNLGKAKQLKTALIKLNLDNLGFPIFDWMYSAWHHSHPPLMERIAALETDNRKKD